MKMKSEQQATAGNERFCKMAAVTPQQQQCELGSYYPAASVVEAATSQSRRTLCEV